MRTRIKSSSLMITTVKNIRGYYISLGIIILSSLCALFIGILGYSMDGVRGHWFTLLGFAASCLAVIHHGILLFNRRPYTRLLWIDTSLIGGYVVSLILSILVPTLLTDTYKNFGSTPQSNAIKLFSIFALDALVVSVLFISVYFRNRQKVQRYLHPYTEIIDSFTKSSGSIQMSNIPSSNLSQVVVTGKEDEKDDGNGSVEEPEVSPENKADGSSPRPSKVLKTWPKPDPFPVRGLYSFKPTVPNELPFKKGDTITVLDCRGRWWQAQKDDRIGFIPSNYVSVLLRARVISNFTAYEDDQVSVQKDQVIEVMERYTERCLVRNIEEKIGAVPSEKLEFLDN